MRTVVANTDRPPAGHGEIRQGDEDRPRAGRGKQGSSLAWLISSNSPCQLILFTAFFGAAERDVFYDLIKQQISLEKKTASPPPPDRLISLNCFLTSSTCSQEKEQTEAYKNLNQVVNDLELMFTNATTFNQPDSTLYNVSLYPPSRPIPPTAA